MQKITFDILYDYVDQRMIEGCKKAEKIIENHGYNATYEMLYDYVDQQMTEGCLKAELIIKNK